METTTSSTPYSFAQKAFFAFSLFFFGLTIVNGVQSGITNVSIYGWLVPQVGKLFPALRQPLDPNGYGSGDSSWGWAELATQLIVGVVLTAIFLAVTRKPRNYDRPAEFLWVVFRYFLIMNMFGYGFAKVFHMQMPAPGPSRLIQSYGDSSPMGLLWTFVGYSKYYSAYTGWAEVVPGILLLFRRTTLLGAVMAAVVMLNVFVLNMCFDVPVKIYSFFLFCLAILVALPGMGRLWSVFIGHGALDAAPVKPFFAQKKWQIASMVGKGVVLAAILFTQVYAYFTEMDAYQTKAKFHGIWEVKEVQRNAQTVPPMLTDTSYWRKFMVNWEGYAGVRMANDSLQRLEYKMDTVLHTATFNIAKDTVNKYVMHYEMPQPDQLVFAGQWGADSLRVRMERFDENRFLLVRRGFHWVNERPFNR
jgi:uncharacterized membrane protein YphA (DoxX/SURF4 family)